MGGVGLPFQLAGGLGALGSAFSGITSWISKGNQATAMDHAALQSSEEAGVNAQEQLQQGDATAAEGAVRAAANGGGETGSSIGVIQNLSDEAMFNARTSIYRGNVQRQNDLYEAGVDRAEGTDALIGGAVGAGSSLVGGFAQGAQSAQMAQSIAALRGEVYPGMGQ